MYQIHLETAQDVWEIEALFDLCFTPSRAALSSYRLREGVPPIAALSLLLRDEQHIITAAIRYWPIYVASRKALLLGPIAVHPTRQAEGLGGYLIMQSLERAAKLGWTRVLLVGDAPYYARFGFEKLSKVRMPPPTNPERILGKELVAGAWQAVTGKVRRISDNI